MLDQDVQPAMDNLNQAINSAKHSMDTLDSAIGDARPGLKTFSNQTVPEVNQLVHDLRNMTEALASIRLGYNRGLAPRAIEILTPAPDRSWGAKRVGLSEERPVLVLVEPWGRQSSVSGELLDDHMSSVLERLEPPIGWHLHEDRC